MSYDWKSAIVKVAYWKQIAHDHDKTGAIPWHLPKKGALDSKILQVESTCSLVLPDSYKEFLSFANGWCGFYISTDLYGTEELRSERAREVLKRPELSEFLASLDIDIDNCICIGASEFDVDVFVMISASSRAYAGHVFWWAGEEVDRFSDFAEFFDSMISYNERIASRMKEEN